jgi:predicted kinase
MKNLILVRGLPGSGKSTFAHLISDTVFEADEYFMRDGNYNFDKEQLPNAHHWCKAQVIAAMIEQKPLIVVSNTMCRKWEMIAYVQLAKAYDYTVTEVTMTQPLRPNVHGVPEEVIERMKATWNT